MLRGGLADQTPFEPAAPRDKRTMSMTKSPGTRDPRGRRRKPKATPPPIDESIKLWVPSRGEMTGMYVCPPSRAEVEARYNDRRTHSNTQKTAMPDRQ